MKKTFEKLIDSPLKDTYKAQQARIFHIILLSFGTILIIGSLILLIHNILYHPTLNDISMVNFIAVSLSLILSYIFSKKGYYHAGVYIFLTVITISTSYALYNRGLSFTITLLYAISVVTAGLLIGPKSSFVFASFNIVGYLAVFNRLSTENRIIHPDIHDLMIFNVVTFVCSMLVLTILTSLISQGMKQRVEELNRSNKQRARAVREAKMSLKEKEILLREIHHRVKNNLQIISSLLSLQSGQHNHKTHHDVLQDTQNRVKSMSLIHEKLYMASDMSQIDFDEYLKVLVNHMAMSYLIDPDSVRIDVEVDDIVLDVDTAISCGLVINELVSNSMKYAFEDRVNGIINISMKVGDTRDSLTLVIADNGIGLPATLDIRNLESLGLQLVDTLVCEMKGNVRLISKEGTKFIITIPYSVSRGD